MVLLIRGWSSCLEAPAPYQEFAQRWGNADFTAYCDLLKQLANTALLDPAVDVREVENAKQSVSEVLQLEVGFWDMALLKGDEE